MGQRVGTLVLLGHKTLQRVVAQTLSLPRRHSCRRLAGTPRQGLRRVSTRQARVPAPRGRQQFYNPVVLELQLPEPFNLRLERGSTAAATACFIGHTSSKIGLSFVSTGCTDWCAETQSHMGIVNVERLRAQYRISTLDLFPVYASRAAYQQATTNQDRCARPIQGTFNSLAAKQ